MKTRSSSNVEPTGANIELSLTDVFQPEVVRQRFRCVVSEYSLFGDVEAIRDSCDIRIRVCCFYLEDCWWFTQRQANAAFVTRLITPLSSKTLVGWKIELVTLGFNFDGVCFFVPDGVALLFVQILIALGIIFCEQALPVIESVPPRQSFVIDAALVNEQAFSRLDECEFIAGMQAAFLDNFRRNYDFSICVNSQFFHGRSRKPS